MAHSRKYLWQDGVPAACLLALVILWACSGGSSGDGAQAEGAFGRVGVLITDAPSNEYEHIWVTITEISLLTADCGGHHACAGKERDQIVCDDEERRDRQECCPDECRDDDECRHGCDDEHDCETECDEDESEDRECGDQGSDAPGEDEDECDPDGYCDGSCGCEKVVTVFSSEEGYTLDLLQYRDDDFLLLINEEVPAGRYFKIRMRISEVRAEGGPCEYLDIKLPGGRIDLNPRMPFELGENDLIYLRLDIDVDKSIHLHTTGSDKCIFRPVVFVDILGGEELSPCPRFIRGQVEDLHDECSDPLPESFTLKRHEKDGGDCLGEIRVCVPDDILVFAGSLGFGSPADLVEGEYVTVWGAMHDGCFTASLIILGDCLAVKGTIEEMSSCEEFLLEPDAREEVAGSVRVVLPSGSPVFTGCDTPAEHDVLDEGMRVLVVGVFDADDQALCAALVLVQPVELAGMLGAVECTAGGYSFVIEAEAGRIREVAVPKGVRIALEGGGPLPENLLPLLACNPYHIRVVTARDNAAARVLVTPEPLAGTVEKVYPYSRTLQIDGLSVRMVPHATGVHIDEAGDTLVSFDILKPGDTITCFGLKSCNGDLEDFHAFAFLLNQ
jgi:hypothetical protein